MKTITCGLTLVLFSFAASAIYGTEPVRGVAGVDVVVKQSPSKRAMTDARGNFAIDTLAPGSYTLTFRSAKAKDTKTPATTDKVTVATSYSIKIDGTKRSINQKSLTSDRLLAGVDIPVEVGAGAKIRGQVAAGALKKMVWIPQEPGSHIPGHWAEAGTVSASNTQTHSRDDMRELLSRGNPNMTDPRPENPGPPQTSGR